MTGQSHTIVGRISRLLPIALIAALPAACGIAESHRIALDQPPPASGTACASALGSYALPKSYLQIKVTQTNGGPPQLTAPERPISAAIPIGIVRRTDPALVFCLDYLASATSHDIITIEKSPRGAAQAEKSAFLGAVLVNASDKTVTIVRTLLRAFFILATGKSDFEPNRADQIPPEVLAELEYDPFDPRESAVVNARLSKLGYCLILEGYTFDTHSYNVDQYCGAPERVGAYPTMVTKAYVATAAVPADPKTPGLLYRALHPYRLAIFQKKDPGGRGSWLLTRMVGVELENLSPVLALDIHRAAFTNRNTNFIFKDGVLLTACIAKNSELEAFAEIPLEIARSIVSVPASIVTVRINHAKDSLALVNAEKSLFLVQQAHLAALTSNAYKTPDGVAVTGEGPKSPTIPDITTRVPGLEYTPTSLSFDKRNEACGVVS